MLTEELIKTTDLLLRIGTFSVPGITPINNKKHKGNIRGNKPQSIQFLSLCKDTSAKTQPWEAQHNSAAENMTSFGTSLSLLSHRSMTVSTIDKEGRLAGKQTETFSSILSIPRTAGCL